MDCPLSSNLNCTFPSDFYHSCRVDRLSSTNPGTTGGRHPYRAIRPTRILMYCVELEFSEGSVNRHVFLSSIRLPEVKENARGKDAMHDYLWATERQQDRFR